MKRLLPYLLLSCLLASCSGDNPPNSNNSNAPTTATSSNAAQIPSPASSPTPDVEAKKRQTEKDAEEKEIQQTKALEEYLAKHYKGWKLNGTAGSSGSICDEYSPCDLHLTNGSQNKVVTVMMKQFFHKDGSTYWFVFEARGIDLTRVRIEEIKESERDATLEDLTEDDCQSVIDALRDERDYPDSYEGDYDPRG